MDVHEPRETGPREG